MRRALWMICATAACSSDPVAIEVVMTTGHEEGVVAEDPPVTRFVLRATGEHADGSIELTTEAAPGGTFELGEVPEDALLRFEVTGFDGGGTPVMQGRTLSLVVGSASSGAIPVFVQRVGSFARPPGGLLRAHAGAPAGIMGERYLLTTGGSAFDASGPTDAAAADFYDLLALRGASSPPLGRVARSMIARATQALLIDDLGASTVDFETGAKGEVTLPPGLASFAEVAGGRTIEAADGSSYVVGATRADAPSRAVLRVAADGTLTGVVSEVARRGAAATWIDGVGLVLIGGSDDGPGLEALGDSATTFVALDWPSDPISGAAAVIGGPQTVLVMGGVDAATAPAATRRFDLSCGAECEPETIDGAGLPEAIEGASGFALADGSFLVVGDVPPAPGSTLAYRVRVAPASVEAVPLREKRRGATVTPTPHGAIGVLGGIRDDDTPLTSIELFFPP